MTYKNPFYPDLLKARVFLKGAAIPGYDPGFWRTDACGAVMYWLEYGNTNSQFGWEVDHIYPASKGGSDELYNLQPLQWQNNRAKGDGLLVCAIKRAA